MYKVLKNNITLIIAVLFLTMNSFAEEIDTIAIINAMESDTLNKDTIKYTEFVQIFFADSAYQRKHVCFPLVLCYMEEQDATDNSSLEQNTILINDTNYQILRLDARSEIKISENGEREFYVVVSIPDTALEAELYFTKKNDIYLLNKINITGDGSPFIY